MNTESSMKLKNVQIWPKPLLVVSEIHSFYYLKVEATSHKFTKHDSSSQALSKEYLI